MVTPTNLIFFFFLTGSKSIWTLYFCIFDLIKIVPCYGFVTFVYATKAAMFSTSYLPSSRTLPISNKPNWVDLEFAASDAKSYLTAGDSWNIVISINQANQNPNKKSFIHIPTHVFPLYYPLPFLKEIVHWELHRELHEVKTLKGSGG